MVHLVNVGRFIEIRKVACLTASHLFLLLNLTKNSPMLYLISVISLIKFINIHLENQAQGEVELLFKMSFDFVKLT